jgi:hypothetical protein
VALPRATALVGRVRAPFDSSNFRLGGSTVQPGRIALNDAVLV